MINTNHEKKLPAEQAKGQHENGANELENGFNRKSNDPERQEYQPYQRKKDNEHEGERPAEGRQNEPQQYNNQ
jgi:hypothetical protein